MGNDIEQKLRKILPPGAVRQNEPMSRHTTFRVGGPADLLVCPTAEQLPQVLFLAEEENIPTVIIGNGSNLLVGDQGIRGLVIEIGPAAASVELDGPQMRVGAGTLLSKAASAAANAGLSGLEFAAGIPGTIGGAVVMNAGAYGGEMKDVLVEATVLAPSGEKRILSVDELELSYRHSCIPEKGYVVLEAAVQLTPKPKEEICGMMAQLRQKRVEKQPLEYPSAGSTFRRPEGYFAGKLIEDAGLRGYRVGDAQVSQKHCGFVVNRGNATAAEILQLIRDVQDRVYGQFQVRLEPEVRILGDFF